MKKSITFIGGGNLASSLIKGLIATGYDKEAMKVSDPSEKQREMLEAQFHIKTFSNNYEAVKEAQIIVLVVKPQVLKAVAEELAKDLIHQPLIISVAAGIPIHALSTWLGEKISIVRAIPNTAAAVGLSATALFANPSVSPDEQQWAEELMQAIGMVRWVDEEEKIDTITALASSGPAYFFYMMQAMQEAGVALGLDANEANEFVLQTALGASTLAKQSEESLETLRMRVTSPQGTTEQGVKQLELLGMKEMMLKAVKAAKERAVEMARMYK